MSFGERRPDRTNYVHSPHLKWPGRSCRTKRGENKPMSWCLMNEVTMDLTSETSFSVSDDVKEHL